MDDLNKEIEEYEKIDIFNIDKRIYFVKNILNYHNNINDSHNRKISIQYWNSILNNLYKIGFEYF